MRFRLPILLAGLAIYLSFGFAALAQLPPASAVKSADWKLLTCRPTPTRQVVEALPVAPPCSDFAPPPIEVREIDFDGLKKILQRDPKDTRPMLINFWATWCDGCREEFPDLVKIDNDYRNTVNFISVSLDDVADIKTTVPEFLAKMKAQMPVVLLNVKDPEPAIKAVDATWDGALPATYLYDKDGKVVFKYFGAIKPAELRKAIDMQLGSKQ